VLFAYAERHTQDFVKELFDGFKGFLQCGAHDVYDILERGPPKQDGEDGIKLVGCWASCGSAPCTRPRTTSGRPSCWITDGVRGSRALLRPRSTDRQPRAGPSEGQSRMRCAGPCAAVDRALHPTHRCHLRPEHACRPSVKRA
jgi:hypothetical protein